MTTTPFENTGKYLLGCGWALAVLMSPDDVFANGVSVLYAFEGGSDGCAPEAALLRSGPGNLYGTTVAGAGNGCTYAGCGAVFKLAANGKETLLHSFSGGNDGGLPAARLTRDAAGDLYGTTFQGGAHGYGVVFKLAADGTETVLHSFTGGKDGGNPPAGLIWDKKGNLYGTTSLGGGEGTVFKLTPDGSEKVLYSFSGGNDGGFPISELTRDAAGNLYGATLYGGANSGGVVFKLAPDGAETVLHAFAGGTDGWDPSSGLAIDGAGNLYGATTGGGSGRYGTLFKVAPDGSEAVLYDFCTQAHCSDGAGPVGTPVLDSAGNLYGTTGAGGANEYGSVFKITPKGKETLLYSFTGRNDGGTIAAGLIADSRGRLYGTAFSGGGSGCGTVFSLKE